MRTILLVALCGALGALCRWKLGYWLNKAESFPFGTLLVNALGSFLLGFLMAFAASSPQLPSAWKAPLITALGVGFLGSFTTFSSFAVESITIFEAQQWRNLFLYLGAQLILGLSLAYVGLWFGRQLFPASA